MEEDFENCFLDDLSLVAGVAVLGVELYKCCHYFSSLFSICCLCKQLRGSILGKCTWRIYTQMLENILYEGVPALLKLRLENDFESTVYFTVNFIDSNLFIVMHL